MFPCRGSLCFFFLCANKGWTTNPKTSQNIRIADELWCCGICGFSNELNIRLFDWLPDATTNFCMICMSRTFLALLVKHLGKLGTCCSSPFPGPFFWYPKIWFCWPSSYLVTSRSQKKTLTSLGISSVLDTPMKNLWFPLWGACDMAGRDWG